MQTYFFPLWYSSCSVLCTFKCAKHHLCLAGPWDSRWKRGRLCFLSHGDFALGLPSPLHWLVERVSKQTHPVSQFLYIFCTQRAKCIFFPLHRKMYKASVREAASPPLPSLLAADRQAERSCLKLQNKENKLAGTCSWVPKDCFCSFPACSQPVQWWRHTAVWRPHSTAALCRLGTCHCIFRWFHFSTWFIHFLEHKNERSLWRSFFTCGRLLVRLGRQWSDFVMGSTGASKGAAASRAWGLTVSGGGGFPAGGVNWEPWVSEREVFFSPLSHGLPKLCGGSFLRGGEYKANRSKCSHISTWVCLYGRRLTHAVSSEEFMKKLWQFVGRPPGFRMRCGQTAAGAAFFSPPRKVTSLGKKPQDFCQNSILHSWTRDAAAVCVDVCAWNSSVRTNILPQESCCGRTVINNSLATVIIVPVQAAREIHGLSSYPSKILSQAAPPAV